MKEFLEDIAKIDWLSNIVIITLLSLSSGMYFNKYIYGEIQSIDKQKEDYKKALYLYKKIEIKNQNVKNLFDSYKNQNTNILNKFEKHTTKSDFLKLHRKHFLSLDIKQGKTIRISDNISYKLFHAKGYIKSVKEFYNFLRDIEKCQFFLEVSLPVKIKSEDKKLYIEFDMKAYNIKTKKAI